jgi:hypothetical protein
MSKVNVVQSPNRARTLFEAQMGFDPLRRPKDLDFSRSFFLLLGSSSCPHCLSKTELLNAYYAEEHKRPEQAGENHYPLYYCDVGQGTQESDEILSWVGKTVGEEIRGVPRMYFFVNASTFFRVPSEYVSLTVDNFAPKMLTDWAVIKMVELYTNPAPNKKQ